MIKIKSNLRVAVAGMATALLLFSTSCTKDDYNSGDLSNPSDTREIKDKDTRDEIRSAADQVPAISWYNSAMDKIITFDPKNEEKSFDFSDPNPGWNTSSADDVYWQPAQNGGGILFIGPGAFGGNTGSGTVVAGNTALNITTTFCFAASEEAIGLDVGGFGGPEFDGISGVVGIAGDLEALANQEFEDDDEIFDYFEGLAYYVVYDNEASGNYDILNWFDNLDGEDPDDLGGDGFAWVYGFSPDEWSLYFSKNGQLNVSGGNINFEGNYFGLVFSLNELDEDIFNFDFVEVTGFGQMGC